MINKYLDGKWQIYRFIAGGISLVLLNFLVFTSLGSDTQKLLGFHSIELIKSLGFLLFIVIMEGWIWYERVIRKARLDLIKDLEVKYYLRMKKTK
jgi:hypothetical protein